MILGAFPPADEIARLTARALLQVEAVAFRADPPFVHASGLPSPTYVDCRRLIGFPRLRAMCMDFMAATVIRAAGPEAFDVIAGGETAGIPFAAWLAERMGLPMAYVRKKPKGYGRNARIEGRLDEGDRVLLVEDLSTDGGSKLGFVEALREAGGRCGHAAVVFRYGIFPEAEARLGEAGVALHGLCAWWDVLAEAQASGAFDAAVLEGVEGYLRAPRAWQAAHRVG